MSATCRSWSRLALRQRVITLSLLVSLTPALGWSQSATGMAGNVIGANEEVTNAAQAAEEALKSAATKGEATRGASGAIASLLTSSDQLICSAWVVSFRTRYRNMVIEGADAKALGAMQRLMEKVEKECDKVLSPGGPKNVKVGGGGQPVEEDKPKPIYPYCPECDPLKRALDQRTYEHERAQYQLNVSMRWTDFVEAAYKSGKSKAEIHKATGGETPQSAEKSESRMRAKVSNARMKMEAARTKLLECLEKCNNENKKKYSFLGNNSTTYAIAGGAALGVGLAVSGGGDDPASQSFASRASTPAAESVPGYVACAGWFNASFDVASDPGFHRTWVGMPRNMGLEVSFASIHIRGSEPFVDVTGTIDANGMFEATGLGTVAGYDNVTVRMSGSLSNCTESSGSLEAEYSMGTHRELPGGDAITYTVRGSQ